MLHRLDEDVLEEILRCCDVHTVLTFSSVSTNCRRIALRKHLWLALAQDLVAKGILDCWILETLGTHTAADMVEEVRLVVQGPRTWSPKHFGDPQVRRSRRVTIDRPAVAAAYKEVALLPGGRYATVYGWLPDGLWDLWEGRQHGGETANVLHICTHAGPPRMTVSDVHLQRGESGVPCHFALPERATNIEETLFAGDYALVVLFAAIVVVNWRTKHSTMIPTSTTRPCVKLIPTHLIYTVERDNASWIDVVTLNSLEWRKITGEALDIRTPPRAVAPAVSHLLDLPPDCHHYCLNVDPHPLRRDTFRIAFYSSSSGFSRDLNWAQNCLMSWFRTAYRGPLLSQFNLDTGVEPCTSVPLAPRPAGLCQCYGPRTFSGYSMQDVDVLGLRMRGCCKLVVDTRLVRDGVHFKPHERRILGLGSYSTSAENVDLTPMSCALTTVAESEGGSTTFTVSHFD
ncbi:hypothetical protein MKEN_00406100 [Mycena kentingensis (nom. inval.)]|nr:hypothetical protein MKEN_00406100 [Mycena kentingensis (nom. inval.)]